MKYGSMADGRGLSSVAYEKIMAMILARSLSAGSVVQERRLAEELGMSRTPIREALRRLEAEGWLVRLNSRTIAVKKATLDEYVSALQVRELLEPAAASIAARRLPPEKITGWKKEVEALAGKSVPDAKQLWEFDDSLHLGIADSTGNPVLATMIRELRKTTQLFENQTLPPRPAPGYMDHLALIEALERGDANAAREAMATHLAEIKRRIFEAL